jgi:hypothetical protein
MLSRKLWGPPTGFLVFLVLVLVGLFVFFFLGGGCPGFVLSFIFFIFSCHKAFRMSPNLWKLSVKSFFYSKRTLWFRKKYWKLFWMWKRLNRSLLKGKLDIFDSIWIWSILLTSPILINTSLLFSLLSITIWVLLIFVVLDWSPNR